MTRETRRIGRPPGPHADTLGKLLPTALRLFLEEGGSALTPTRLHQETGISRATIYRNWPDPADLIEIMLSHATEAPPSEAFRGDLRSDLRTAADILVTRFNERPARAFFGACLEYGRRSAGVERAAERFIAGILEPFRQVVAEAIDRGELDGDEHGLVLELAGPLVLDHVVMGNQVTKRQGRAIVDAFVDRHTASD